MNRVSEGCLVSQTDAIQATMITETPEPNPAHAPTGSSSRRDHARQLFHFQLPSLFVLDRRARRGGLLGAGPSPACGHASRHLSPHPVLPETVPFLLFQGLYRQEGRRNRRIFRCVSAGIRALFRKSIHWRQEAQVHLFRRRNTLLYFRHEQLTRLVDEMKRRLSWEQAEEITFECENRAR